MSAVTLLAMIPTPTAVAAGPKPRTFLREAKAGKAEVGTRIAGSLPSNFQDVTVFSGLTNPTAIRFSPDGRVFVAEKSGVIKVFSSVADTTPTVFADLHTEVDDFWDRGMVGLALDPSFPSKPYIYVTYPFDAPIGGQAPTWNDGCPTPPGATTDGCVIGGRLSRLTASGNVMSAEKVLVEDWCQQYPSHSVDDIEFGPDGALYMSAGEGANFNALDYGQFGGTSGSPPVTPQNPCGDPPGGVGGTMTSPTAEGGSLRAQSVRRPAGEPVVLSGSIIRVDPATGAAKADNPLAANPDANAKRIVGYGLRNPFRFTFRPGTSELWVGDVGQNVSEEIDRITNPKSATVANGGWPCYEGDAREPSWDAADVNVCESLYSTPTGLLTPYYAYSHGSRVVTGESCPIGSSSISGLAFYGAGTYPSAYRNALFFADHSRNCIWAMEAGSGGLPDTARIVNFMTGAANPVDLQIGPGGDLWYVDLEGGKVHRIVYDATNNAPTAAITATPTSGAAPLTVQFDGRASSDPDAGDTLTYSWDLDGDGSFGDAVLPTASFTYQSTGAYTVALAVTDSHGSSVTATQLINVGNALPRPVIDSPASSFTWKVGDSIAFSGHATDSTGKAIPASGLSWAFVIYHCPSDCHTHAIRTFAGVASGSFPAPDHEYPSYLELTLTATDGAGRTASTSVRLDPKTAALRLASVPTGVQLSVGSGTSRPAPYSVTVIQGSTQTVTAPPSQTLNGVEYQFDHWSDGGAATHATVVPSTGLTLTATYRSSGATTSYLSDLAWTQAANGWGPVETDMSNGEQAAGDGHPLTLNGTVYAKGLGGHAASDVRYTMNGGCSSFSVKVGVDDEVPPTNGSVVFQVFADGVKLADSGLMTGATATKGLTVDVTGRTTLQLVITNGDGSTNGDHGDWADAALTCGGDGSPPDTTPPTITSKSPALGATGVVRSVRPSVVFSEAIDPATLTPTTFTLTPSGGGAVAATVSWASVAKTATLTPTLVLAGGTKYTVRVKGGASGIADLAGNRLANDVSWTFTTSTGPASLFLSDLPWTQISNGWGPVETDMSNGEQAAGDGHALTLNGTVYAKGLGVHAASDVRYTMNGACSSFSVKVGVDDEVPPTDGSVVFQIFADGTKLADSGVMTGKTATRTLIVNVSRMTTLELVVTNSGDTSNADHADWADPRLSCR
ncbi:MAG TPA: NPCBM/NEW2 domain-containing protein [Candidatus Limnocylindrales bacterium]|nr:NPCBM/NEW2 domain-containing protein [Candidatus Limnocylindrales bacterium]